MDSLGPLSCRTPTTKGLACFPCACSLLSRQGILGERQQDKPLVEHHILRKAGNRAVSTRPGHAVDTLQSLV
jgi:hypothetical protein